MRIGIDVSRTIPKKDKAGIGKYAGLLVQGLADLETDHQFVLYPGLGDFVHPEYGVSCDISIPDRPNFTKYAGSLPAFSDGRRRSRRDAVDLVHATAFACPDVAPARLAVTIYDLTYHLMPELHLPSNIEFCERNMERAVERADMFIAISETTRKDFITRYAVPDERVAVVHLAAESIFVPVTDRARIRQTLERLEIPQKYVLSVGTVEPRKNIARLLRAFAVLSTAGRYADHALVIVGTPGWLSDRVYELPAELGIEDRVRFLGHVDDEDLPALYSAAQVFVYPSLYEGFGLPVLEAMSCGAPVIASNLASLPEVAGDAGILVDPRDVGELARAMSAVLGDIELMGSMRTRSLKRAQLFSVSKMARDTVRAYEAAGRGTSRRGNVGWRATLRRVFSPPLQSA